MATYKERWGHERTRKADGSNRRDARREAAIDRILDRAKSRNSGFRDPEAILAIGRNAAALNRAIRESNRTRFA